MSRPGVPRVAVAFLMAGACAGHRSPPEPGVPRVVQSSSGCTKFAQGDVSSRLSTELATAPDVLSFETVWRHEHANAVSGTVSRADVLSAIHRRGDQIRGCYLAALERLPDDSGGKVVVRFVIDAVGHVPVATVAADGLGVPEVACCLTERITHWAFPAPHAGDFVVVEYPFSVHVAK